MQPYQEDLLAMTGVTVTDGWIVTHLNLSCVTEVSENAERRSPTRILEPGLKKHKQEIK